MKLKIEKDVYEALKAVFIDKKYSTIALNDILSKSPVDSKPAITAIFYGVLENSLEFDWILDKLVEKKPQISIAIIIKIGLYFLRKTDTPSYASVSKTVDLAKAVGKSGASGFINAVLKKSISIKLPEPNNIQNLSIISSFPVWILEKLQSKYDFGFAKAFVLAKPTTNTHIRVNLSHITRDEFEKKYPNIIKNRTKYGYYVCHTAQKAIDNSDYIVQSLASIKAVHNFIKDFIPKKILDLCASPGGKAVYLKQLFPEAEIVACDIHDHRVALIQQYASKVGTKITTLKNDATILNPNFINKFDLVICDVPCSGIGVAHKKPDILLTKKPGDISSLTAIQKSILQTASNYIVPNGRLCYSTCTVFSEENENIIDDFLESNNIFFQPQSSLNLYPHIHGTDGFFATILERR